MNLRPYQRPFVDEVRRHFALGRRRVLGVMPTGAGKTVAFSHVCAGAAARGKRVSILGHRIEIVEQISNALTSLGIRHGMVVPGSDPGTHHVEVASVATLARRLNRWRPSDLVIVDEAHHAVAGTWRAILRAAPAAFVLGCTATPERLDGRGLGDLFDEIVIGPDVAELTAAGFLVPAVIYAPAVCVDLSRVRTRGGDYAVDDLASSMGGVVIGAAVRDYRRLAHGRPAVAFCVDRTHSEAVAARFREAGYRAVHVDGDTSPKDRRAALAALGAGELDVVSNCGLISEGVDIPAVGAAILLRPTKSVALHLQQVGRALRPAPGKSTAIILDHAGNTLRHGLPDARRFWSLEGKSCRVGERPPSAGLQRCPACGAISSSLRRCEGCGATPKASAKLREIDVGELHKAIDPRFLESVQRWPYPAALRWAGNDAERLRTIALARGYRPGWVAHRLEEIARGVSPTARFAR